MVLQRGLETFEVFGIFFAIKNLGGLSFGKLRDISGNNICLLIKKNNNKK
jgi:hypothetical protein